MARSWCGFLPQNQSVKEQWGLLEMSQFEIQERLERLLSQQKEDSQEQMEDEEMIMMRLNRMP